MRRRLRNETEEPRVGREPISDFLSVAYIRNLSALSPILSGTFCVPAKVVFDLP